MADTLARARDGAGDVIPVTTEQYVRILAAELQAPDGNAVVILGSPGGGKTMGAHAAAAQAGMRVLPLFVPGCSPETITGYPDLRDGARRATHRMFGTLADAMEATEPTLLFLDEIGNTVPAVQTLLGCLILEGRIGEHHLPACVRVSAAGNYRTDGSGSQGLISTLDDRAMILHHQHDTGSWCRWAIGAGVDPITIGFVRSNPDIFSRWTARGPKRATPRSLTAAGRILARGATQHPEDLEPMIAGRIGRTDAQDLLAFRELWLSCGSVLRAIDADPATAPMPTDHCQAGAICGWIGGQTTARTWPARGIYLDRLAHDGHADAAGWAWQWAETRLPDLCATVTSANLRNGPLGDVRMGDY